MLETTITAIAAVIAVGALVLMALSSVLPDLLDGCGNDRNGSSGRGVSPQPDRCPDSGDSSERGRHSGAELALLEPRTRLPRPDQPNPGFG